MKGDMELYMYDDSLSLEHHMFAHKALVNLAHCQIDCHKEGGDKFCCMHVSHTVWSSHRAYCI